MIMEKNELKKELSELLQPVKKCLDECWELPEHEEFSKFPLKYNFIVVYFDEKNEIIEWEGFEDEEIFQANQKRHNKFSRYCIENYWHDEIYTIDGEYASDGEIANDDDRQLIYTFRLSAEPSVIFDDMIDELSDYVNN